MAVLVKLPGPGNLDLFRVEDGLREEGQELFIAVGEYIDGDGVYCQLYRGWRQGECSLRVGPDGEGLVEAAGESIEVWGLGGSRSVRVRACERHRTTVVDLGDETFGWEAV